MPPVQSRSARTRAELLAAAADVIAVQGVERASVDAIASAAGRTSGSLYGQFGSKDALVLELMDALGAEVATRVRAGLSGAVTLDDRLLALWHGVAGATSDDGAGHTWVRLEQELFRWAVGTGDEAVLHRLRTRQRAGRDGVALALREWEQEGLLALPLDPTLLARAVLGLLSGLEAQRRVDPEGVDDSTALAALRALLGVRQQAGSGPVPHDSPSRTDRTRTAPDTRTAPPARPGAATPGPPAPVTGAVPPRPR